MAKFAKQFKILKKILKTKYDNFININQYFRFLNLNTISY